MSERKTIKVVFEYDDGTSKYLDGEELTKWLDMVGSVCMIAHVHRANPDWDKVKWTEVKQEKGVHY